MRKLLFSFIAAVLTLSTSAYAEDMIIRPYQSARESGMGSVRYTTGLYDENFFGNPARVTANPTWRIEILNLMAEVSAPVPGAIGSMTGGGASFFRSLGNNAGSNYHARIQTAFPAVYIPPGEGGKWGFALGLITSTQGDVNLRQSFNIEPTVVTDIGPAFTVGRKLLEDNNLSVGLTTHVMYRLSSNTGFTFVNLIKGSSISPSKTGGQGGDIDADLGATYDFVHAHPLDLDLSAAVTINDLLGGNFTNLKLQPIKDGAGNPTPASRPISQPRSFNFGGAARRSSLFIFHDFVGALEFTDIGNNTNGSLFRTIHLGSEAHWKILAARIGINQGYICAGGGVDLKILEINFATYGEELSLNSGGLEDRRYALQLQLHI